MLGFLIGLNRSKSSPEPEVGSAPFLGFADEDTPAFWTSFAIGGIFQKLESRVLNRANRN